MILNTSSEDNSTVNFQQVNQDSKKSIPEQIKISATP